MTTPQRIEALKKNARRLWPKYDPDLDTMVNGRNKIHKYIEHIFEETKLKSELEQLKKECSIDDLIDRQIEKAKKNQSSVIWQANKDLGSDAALNQAQCINLIDELYGIRADSISKIDASRTVDKKKSKMTANPDKSPA